MPHPGGVPNLSQAEWSRIPATEIRASAAVDFTAIIALSNCSGGLVRFEGSLSTDPAMVLTNGHCLDEGFLSPGTVMVNRPVFRSLRLLRSDGKASLGSLRAARVIYATMTKTDMALYGLQETYDDIEKNYGVRALTLSSRHPVAGRQITIPSGYWKKIYQCSIDRFVHELREDKWTWSDSILYKQPGCATIGGTSGSPIIDTETYEVIGVNNTGNDTGGRCTMNNPCEVDEDGNVTVTRKASYGQEVYWIYGCLNSRNELQLDKPGCQLPSGR
ncbi:MAG: hypothetical protein A2X94_02445 [Bdellovibrionales bacterium GWB1_55_8]|nr:MAG: hypothetical protein A2X94_02445 [Bdellovibrionales bacterium GWB1_55_8]